jgi:hypothetical protein
VNGDNLIPFYPLVILTAGGKHMANDLTMTVLSKVIPSRKASAHRDGVTAGEYPVDFTVRVSGLVNVKEDTEKVPTVSIPVKEVLGLFISRSGALRDANIALMKECITDALNNKGTKGAQGALTAEFDAAFGQVVAGFLSTLPKTKVRGEVEMDGLTVTVTEG